MKSQAVRTSAVVVISVASIVTAIGVTFIAVVIWVVLSTLAGG